VALPSSFSTAWS